MAGGQLNREAPIGQDEWNRTPTALEAASHHEMTEVVVMSTVTENGRAEVTPPTEPRLQSEMPQDEPPHYLAAKVIASTKENKEGRRRQRRIRDPAQLQKLKNAPQAQWQEGWSTALTCRRSLVPESSHSSGKTRRFTNLKRNHRIRRYNLHFVA